MKAKEFVHHGWTRAAAFVVDTGLIGENVAQERVLELYQPGLRVCVIDERHWLVILPEPVEIDARSAPGLVLVEAGGRLVGAPDVEHGGADIAFWQSGTIARVGRSSILEIDPTDWIAVDDLPIERLEPLDLPLPTEAAEAPPLLAPDLRKLAHVHERSTESKEIGAALAAQESGARTRAGSRTDWGSAGTSGGPGVLGSIGSFVASLVLRSPIGGEVRRRQYRYLERLAGQFDGDLDEALRNAIPLGGLGESAYSLRMPRPRTSLQITRHGLTRHTSIDLGPTVFVSLQTLYRRAAEQLEAAGRLEEAAFALVELLNSPHDGVAMLERHGRFELAAAIAEARKLDPTLIVRLWWLAGDRARAVTIARRHGAFGSVIERLLSSDPGQARELRLEWIDSLERAGDVLGAVTAGWPDVHVRPRLEGLIRRGAGIGGPAGAALQAYRLGLGPTEEDVSETRAMVAGFDHADAASLRTFAIALASVTPEPAIDREFASLAIRALTRIRRPSPDGTYTRAHRALRDRADPTLRADLPSIGAGPRATSIVDAPAQPAGLIRIWDAAALPNDMTLVALGEGGCRLLTPDGRTAASWDVSAHRFVNADHGGAALVLSSRGEIHETLHLDLTTRKIRRYGAIRSSLVADTFDGAIWPVVDERGVAFHDTTMDAPLVIWRELEPGWLCYRLARDEHQLAAIIGIPSSGPAEGRLELWRWSLPGITLNARAAIQPDQVGDEVALLSDAVSVWKIPGASPKLIEPHLTGELGFALRSDGILVSEAMVGLVRATDDGSCQVVVHRNAKQPVPSLRVPLAANGARFRAVGDRVAAWDATGRLVTADLGSGRLITATRLVS